MAQKGAHIPGSYAKKNGRPMTAKGKQMKKGKKHSLEVSKTQWGEEKMKKKPSLSGVSVRGFYGFRHGEDGTSCGFATWRLSGAGGEIVDLKAEDFQR